MGSKAISSYKVNGEVSLHTVGDFGLCGPDAGEGV